MTPLKVSTRHHEFSGIVRKDDSRLSLGGRHRMALDPTRINILNNESVPVSTP